jgi:hypothetical protein
LKVSAKNLSHTVWLPYRSTSRQCRSPRQVGNGSCKLPDDQHCSSIRRTAKYSRNVAFDRYRPLFPPRDSSLRDCSASYAISDRAARPCVMSENLPAHTESSNTAPARSAEARRRTMIKRFKQRNKEISRRDTPPCAGKFTPGKLPYLRNALEPLPLSSTSSPHRGELRPCCHS